MILSKETGVRIRSLLSEKKISVREVQERLGLESPQAVYKWLHGTSLPALDNLLVLSRILGVRMEDILVWEEDCAYPFEIEGSAFKETRERAVDRGEKGRADRMDRVCRADGAGNVDGADSADRIRRIRRHGRAAGLRHFPDLHTVVRWYQRTRLTEELRRIILCPRGKAGQRVIVKTAGEQ